MSNILLGVHGGIGSEGAVRVASLLAHRLGVGLGALVVLEPMPVLDYGFGVVAACGGPEEEVIDAQLVADASAQLVRCGARDCALRSSFGLPATEIAESAQSASAELIVIGLGPHGVIARTLGHETALELVQTARTPILAVPPEAAALPRRVTAAVDFTPTSIRAVRTAARWLRRGDVLHLLHVRTHAVVAAHAAHDAAGRSYDGRDELVVLRSLAADIAVADGVRVEVAAVDGDPAPAILEFAARSACDLIALGSHGYGMWKRLTLGSVASKVVRLTAMSVLVVPLGSLPKGAV